MRRRTPFVLSFVLLTTGCIVPRSEGFATPQQTVATFQSAYARDDEFLEYDCFAAELKAQGLTQQAWSTARGPLFAPLGLAGRSLLRRNELADNLVAVVGSPPTCVLASLPRRATNGSFVPRPEADLALDYEICGHGLRVKLLAEATLIVPAPDGAAPRAYVLGRSNSLLVLGGGDGAVLHVDVGVPADVATKLVADGAAWLRLERRFKLALPEVIDVGDRPPLRGPPSPPRAHRHATYAKLRPKPGPTAFGVTRIEFTLPIDCPVGASGTVLDAACDEFVWKKLPDREIGGVGAR